MRFVSRVTRKFYEIELNFHKSFCNFFNAWITKIFYNLNYVKRINRKYKVQLEVINWRSKC